MVERAGHGAAFANVLRRELRAAWRGALGWWVPTAALLAMTLSLQPEMAQKGSLFEQKLEAMPKGLMIAFGVVAQNLADPVYYAATNFSLITLLGAVFAGTLGAALAAREEALGTGELLYALPVSRRAVLLGKAAAGLALVVAFDALLFAVARGSYASIGVALRDPWALASLFVAAGALHAALVGVAMLAGISASRPRAAGSRGLVVVFGLYGLNVIGALSESLAGLRGLSPFHYAEPTRILAGGGAGGIVGLILLAALTIGASVVIFERRDIHA